MEKEHTKGDWQVADYLDNETGERSLAVWAGQEKIICLVSPKGSETDEDYANAKLIASAPELLKALIEVVRISDRKHNAWDNAKEVINKATI